MGLLEIADLLRGSRRHKSLQHIRHAGIADPGGELSVGKGSRASLAELDIGTRIQAASSPELQNSGATPIHIKAPLQHKGLPSRTGKGEGRKHARRAKAHDNGTMNPLPPGNDLREGSLFRLRGFSDVPVPPEFIQELSLGDGNRHVQNVDKLYGCPPIAPCIHCLTHNYHLRHSLRW